MEKNINIVLITDSNYIVPTCVTLLSLLKTQPKNTHIFIIFNDKDTSLAKEFFKLENKNNIKISIIQADNSYSKLDVTHPYVTKSSLQKFSIPKLISENKVLYLDTDVVVKSSLESLFLTDITNQYAGVISDLIAMYQGNDHIRLGQELYFNSGVMLLNLEKMRKDNISSELLKYKQSETIHKYMDQDAFNIIFNDNVKYLDLKYNYFPIYVYQTFKELKNIKLPYIIHYAGEKPWKNLTLPFFEEWFSLFKEISPFCEFNYNILEQKINNKAFHLENIFQQQVKEICLLKSKLEESEDNNNKIHQELDKLKQYNTYFHHLENIFQQQTEEICLLRNKLKGLENNNTKIYQELDGLKQYNTYFHLPKSIILFLSCFIPKKKNRKHFQKLHTIRRKNDETIR